MTQTRIRPAVLVLAIATLMGCNIQARSERAFGHYAESQMLAETGDLDAALAELAKAIRADPSLSVAHTAMGDIRRKQGNHRLAAQSYQAACKTNPYSFRPHYNLGTNYQILAEAAKTIKAYNEYVRKAVHTYLRAVIIRPDDFDTNLNLSACYFQLGKYDLAEEYCKAAVAADPDSPQAYSNLGIIYDSQNRLYKAVKAYKASLELDTNQPKILLNLGATYLRQGPNPLGRCKSALRVFEIAAEQAPDDPAPHRQMGACHYRLKDYPTAIEAYQKALTLDKNDAAAYRGLGTVYVTQFVLDRKQTDLRDNGLEAWNASLEIDPDQQNLIRLVRKYTPKDKPPEL